MLIKPGKSNVKLIINLQEVYEIRNRKERELDYYNKELQKLQREMAFIKQEINLTNTIIDIIETEKVVDLREYVENKKNESS
jgi:prefoldin subunit 5|tara:strand:+ start:709 stop:954 length:246 start_codon:yes stop_codon:yes gene_type:complete